MMIDTIDPQEFHSKIQNTINRLNNDKGLVSHYMEMVSVDTDLIYLDMLKLKGLEFVRQHRNEICFPETHIKNNRYFDSSYTYSYKQLFDKFIRKN